MSELAIQQGLQAIIRTDDNFADTSVVINDWSIRDWSSSASPFVLLSTSSVFSVDMSTQCPIYTYDVPVWIMVAWRDWKETYDDFLVFRQSLCDTLAANLTFGDKYWINSIRNGGVVTEFYDPYTAEEQVHEAMPLFVVQQINVSVSEG